MRRGRSTESEHRASYREGLTFGLVSFGAIAVLALVSAVVTARLYGIRTTGAYALVTAPIEVVWFISTIQERPAFVRELTTLSPRTKRVTGIFAAVLAFSFGLTAVMALLGILGVYLIFHGPINQPGLFMPAVVNLSAYVLFTNTSFNLDAIFSGFRAGRQLFWIRLHEQLAFMLLAVGGYFAWSTVWGLVAATVGAALTALIHRVFVVRDFMRLAVPSVVVREGFRTLPAILRFGARSAPGAIAHGLSNSAGTWVLGALGSVSAVGAYNRASMLSRRFVDVSFRINEMLFPTLVERRSGGDHLGFDRALIDSIRYVVVSLLLVAAAGGGAARGIMGIFGPGFSQAATALTILLLLPAMSTVSQMLVHTLYAVDRPVTTSVSGTVRLVITLSSIVPLSLLLGITGTASALVLGYVGDLTFTSFKTRGHLSRPVGWLWPRREVLALILAYGTGFLAARNLTLGLSGPEGATVSLAFGAGAYMAVFWLAGGVNERDYERLRAIRVLARRA